MRLNQEVKSVKGDQISHSMDFHVQPIICCLTDTTFGYEILLRTNESSPLNLFQAAREQNYLYQLDSSAIDCALSKLNELGILWTNIFINVFPSTIVNPQFKYFINQISNKYPDIIKNIIFELNEDIQDEEVWDSFAFKMHINALKKKGFKIAIDDFGTGAANINTVYNVNPHYIKLDKSYSRNLYTSKEKQRVISMITKFKNRKFSIVLEGIENHQDLKLAKQLGVDYCQGYFISRPFDMNRL
ncbi:EAL domain-containing protein (plasmid) [Niallia taxi]|uniref:EAL domain-containing protein n=1 Tax=Niallia taxi TaxID=2499688 RepID=UPI00293523A0|nr:EAL domain-containing protein [Niallia taxi]WOD64886.1 EAL domain-containing protein [Niallia taxi]